MVATALKRLAMALGLILVGLLGYLYIFPPALLKVGTNYAAKMVCSSVFVAHRDAQDVLATDVQAPGHPLLGFVSVAVDNTARRVEARIFGAFAPATSQYREGLGCTNLHDAPLSPASLPAVEAQAVDPWTQGAEDAAEGTARLSEALNDPALLGEGYRAVVVVKQGRIVAETYAQGFDEKSPLLGWSMTKTVTAGVIGAAVQAGHIALQEALVGSFPLWADDNREKITVQDMLAMSSGLEWNEDYGDVSDVTRMLYLEEDMAGFAAQRAATANVGEVFNYSSGTSTMLSRVWQDSIPSDALSFPQTALFEPLGMTSAVLETDVQDTFVGSSYMYATARDWARFGQFLLQKGVWNAQEILPRGYVDWMFAPAPASDGVYSNGHLWRHAPGADSQFEDAVWMRGHDGQYIGIFPARDMVVVRLGLTPSKLGYSPMPLVRAVIQALDR